MNSIHINMKPFYEQMKVTHCCDSTGRMGCKLIIKRVGSSNPSTNCPHVELCIGQDTELLPMGKDSTVDPLMFECECEWMMERPM